MKITTKGIKNMNNLIEELLDIVKLPFNEISNDFFVTPNNIDEAMDILSLILSKGINLALYN